MSGTLMLVGNPAKRRKSRKAPSAAQKRARAAFAAAARSTKAAPARRRRRSARASVSTVVRRARRSVSPRVRRYARRANAGYRLGGIIPMVKNAGAGAAGAVAVDIGFGFIAQYLPVSMQSQTDSSGAPNYMYYLAKSGVAIGIGMVGKKVLGKYAPALVMGSLIVTFHQLLRGFVQNSGVNVPLGYYAPGRQLPPLPNAQNLSGRGNIGKYLPNGSTMGKYVSAANREMMMR